MVMYAPLKNRVKRLEYKVRGELKVKDLNFEDTAFTGTDDFYTTSIPDQILSGTEHGERLGASIHVSRIEITGLCDSAQLFLVRPNDNDAPGIGDFTTQHRGQRYRPEQGWEMLRFTPSLVDEWAIEQVFKFKHPMEVSYSAGANFPIRNNFHIVLSHYGGASTAGYQLNVRVWYYDN